MDCKLILPMPHENEKALASAMFARVLWWSIGESNPWPLQCECSALTSSAFCTPILGFCLVVWGVSNFDRIEASIPHPFFVLKRKNSANMSVISRWPNSFCFIQRLPGCSVPLHRSGSEASPERSASGRNQLPHRR